ncbi:MAG: hypothetical protein PHC68_08310 [Syntrophorhabdaceae bacterium]|nr:hypothetical protein [Syntrophorhabdaceae bacterium]
MSTEELTCKICGRNYLYDTRRGHTKNKCNSCAANKGRVAFKAQVIRYLGGKCIRCGYDKCHAALHVHHPDPTMKKLNRGIGRSIPWEECVKELDQCELLCSNCHIEEHYIHRKEYESLFKTGRPRLPERTKIQWPSDKKLKALVQRLPMTTVGKMFGASDNSVRKRCERLGIEFPKRGHGYWSGKKR